MTARPNAMFHARRWSAGVLAAGWSAVALAAAVVGCTPNKAGKAAPADASAAPERRSPWEGLFAAGSERTSDRPTPPVTLTPLPPPTGDADPDAPRDPQPVVPLVFHVDVYQLSLPAGAVSGNAEFWNRLNEQILDPATYDVLQRNGLRVGEASFADWPFFRDLIDQHPGTVAQAQAVAREVKNLELEMKKDVQFQDIFYYDARNQLIGRSFERCDNVVAVSFQPTPRRPGFMRLTLAPLVRGLRKRLEYSTINNELAEVQFVSPETFYDCNLRLDVPLQSFIVVGPSPESASQTSIGAAFLLKDEKGQRQEQVLIIVPRPYRVDDETGGPGRAQGRR